MKLSLNIGGREFSIGATKSALEAAFMRGDDSDSGSGAQLSNAYQQSVWVYSCVSVIAEQIALIPFRFSRVQAAPMKQRRGAWRKRALGEDIVESGPVVELFNRPHPHLNRFQFWELLVSWLQLRGEYFIVPLDAKLAINPRQPAMLSVLAPDQFREIVSGNALEGWHYTGQGNESPAPSLNLLPTDVITDRLANPYDFWRGASPLMAARVAADTDYAAAQFQKGLMLNNADTGVIVRTDQQLEMSQREQMLAALRERKRKAGTADRPLLLWGGAEVVKPSLSASDMQFLENRKFNRQEICAVFKVSQEIIGFTEDANRSVSESARLNFIENRIAPLCERIEAAMEPFVKLLDPGLWGWFDIESLPIMQSARRARWDGALKAFGVGLPIDDCGELFDLGLPQNLPHAGKSFLPFSLQEFGAESTPLPVGADQRDDNTDVASQGDKPVEDNFKRALGILTQRRKDAKAQAPHVCAGNPEYEAALAPYVKMMRSMLQRYFFEQRNQVLEDFEREQKGGLERKALWDDAVAIARENAKLLARLEKILREEFERGVKMLGMELGQPNFSIQPKEALAFLETRRNVSEEINNTTFDRIKAELAEALQLGESYDQMADRIKAVYKGATDRRAEVIALTETNIAINSGRHGAMVQLGVERKGWQTSHLEGTRESHWQNELHSEANNGIPIDERWPNGLRFPGDPEGEAGEVINCRCFGYAILKK